MNDRGIHAVLDFWFGSLDQDDQPDQQHRQQWFKKDPEFDAEIKRRFLTDIQNASRGEYDHWLGSATGRLAAIILIDQFSRNVFRGTAESFANDNLALSWTLDGIKSGHDAELPLIYRVFFYMPLMHSEDLMIQQLSIQQFQQLLEQAPTVQKQKFQVNLDFAIRHAEIIERFGRFPHRNQIVGRKSTAAEVGFLALPGSSF